MCLPTSGVYTQAKYTGVETFVTTPSDRIFYRCLQRCRADRLGARFVLTF